MNLVRRPRRLRVTKAMRDLVADVDVPRRALMQPLFTIEKPEQAGPIDALPGISRETLDDTLRTIEGDLEKGIKSFLLFGVPARKDLSGQAALDPEGITPRTIAAIRQRFGASAVLAVDVCLCPHLEHGHCGVLKGEEVENDPSVAILAKLGALYASAGADIVAPSDMMDGRIGAMREAMDAAGKSGTALMSYAVKYASNYYGPFREAANSAPAFGDRRAYQMDFRRRYDAIEEVAADLDEGADMVMVKPALAYLDVIARVRDAVDVPVVAYNVSGEFAAVKALAKAGLANGTDLALENLAAMRRAGADVVITYHARELATAGVLS